MPGAAAAVVAVGGTGCCIPAVLGMSTCWVWVEWPCLIQLTLVAGQREDCRGRL